MRKVIIAAALAALPLSGAFGLPSETIVETAENQAELAFTAGTAGGEFVVEDFTYNLSAGVGLSYVQTTNQMGVQTASTKGSYSFSGVTNGGSVTTCGDKVDTDDGPQLAAPVIGNRNGCSFGPAL